MPRITTLVPDPTFLDFEDASMRPGRNAPDNQRHPDPLADAHPAASMRPGRNAPDNLAYPPHALIPSGGFNEAGAKCPG